mmetsp:Transcript_111586/g.310160  ORF Transcript_111586/g.310160 Transcript_111586/m.310160 type:complete len:167 (-) Transcript_111586:71-571(-)
MEAVLGGDVGSAASLIDGGAARKTPVGGVGGSSMGSLVAAHSAFKEGRKGESDDDDDDGDDDEEDDDGEGPDEEHSRHHAGTPEHGHHGHGGATHVEDKGKTAAAPGVWTDSWSDSSAPKNSTTAGTKHPGPRSSGGSSVAPHRSGAHGRALAGVGLAVLCGLALA